MFIIQIDYDLYKMNGINLMHHYSRTRSTFTLKGKQCNDQYRQSSVQHTSRALVIQRRTFSIYNKNKFPCAPDKGKKHSQTFYFVEHCSV